MKQHKIKMKISELTLDSKRVDLDAVVIEKREPRNVNTRFGPMRVADITIEDESGRITLVLWGENIDKINEGDHIQIRNGYITEWNGNLQLNVGKFGKLIVK
jgi:replication factor A1